MKTTIETQKPRPTFDNTNNVRVKAAHEQKIAFGKNVSFASKDLSTESSSNSHRLPNVEAVPLITGIKTEKYAMQETKDIANSTNLLNNNDVTTEQCLITDIKTEDYSWQDEPTTNSFSTKSKVGIKRQASPSTEDFSITGKASLIEDVPVRKIQFEPPKIRRMNLPPKPRPKPLSFIDRKPSKVFKKNLADSMRAKWTLSKNGFYPFQCNFCKLKYSTLESLHRHIKACSSLIEVPAMASSSNSTQTRDN